MANEMVISQIKQRLELLWQAVEKLEGGGDTPSGTSDYNDLSNKPQINGTTLSGNKTASDLGLATSTVVSELSTLVSELDGDIEALQTAVAGKADTADLADYLTTADAASTYQTQAGMSSYLTSSDASSTYQTKLTFDSAPTDGSTNPVESNGVYDALALKADSTALASKIEADSYGSQSTGGTVRVWTTTSGSDTILNIATQDPS